MLDAFERWDFTFKNVHNETKPVQHAHNSLMQLTEAGLKQRVGLPHILRSESSEAANWSRERKVSSVTVNISPVLPSYSPDSQAGNCRIMDILKHFKSDCTSGFLTSPILPIQVKGRILTLVHRRSAQASLHHETGVAVSLWDWKRWLSVRSICFSLL